MATYFLCEVIEFFLYLNELVVVGDHVFAAPADPAIGIFFVVEVDGEALRFDGGGEFEACGFRGDGDMEVDIERLSEIKTIFDEAAKGVAVGIIGQGLFHI